MNASLELTARYEAAIARAKEYSASLEGPSLIEQLSELAPAARDAVLEQLSTLDLARLAYDWPTWARPKQRPDLSEVEHVVLLFLGGRGGGKSRSAAERVRDRVYRGARRIALIGPTIGEIEKYMLGVGEEDEGLLNVFHPKHRPEYVGRPTNTVHFHTGAIGYVNPAESPEFRGANLDTSWCDEPIKWRYLSTMMTNLELATRALSALPIETIVTTTPKPMRFLREMVADPMTTTILSRMTDNASNLSPLYLANMQRKYTGTRLGAQELEGEILGDNEGALFKATLIDETRVDSEPPNLRKVIALDPAITQSDRSDQTGIVGIGDDVDGDQYVFADRSGKHRPEAWGRIAIDMYDQNQAEAIVAEKNRGGDLVESNIRAAMFKKRGGVAADAVKVVLVHAVKGKEARAHETVSTLFAQRRIHLVGRELVELEQQMTEWDPRAGGPSPNSLDAFVWGSWYLGRLGEEARPDRRETMQGLSAMNAAIRARAGLSGSGVPIAPRPSGRSPFSGGRSRRTL